VLVLFTAGVGKERPGDLFLLFYLLSPTVQAGFDWAQLFYFDLKRLETARFTNLRARYERFLERMALVLGLAFGAIASAIGFLLLGRSLGVATPLVVTFFVSRSALGLTQIRAFSARYYGALLSSGAVLLAGMVGIGLFVDAGWAKLLGLTAASTLVLAWLRRVSRRWDRDDEWQIVLPPLDWARALREERGPLRIREAVLSTRTTRTGERPRPGSEDDSAWALHRAALRIGRRLGQRGAVTTFGPDRVVWYERDGKALSETWLFTIGGGLWKSVETLTEGETAGSVQLLDGRRSSAMAFEDEAALRERFTKLFPKGLVCRPKDPLPAQLTELSSREKRSVLADAQYFAERLRPRRTRGPFEVTALCSDGELKLLFLAPRRGNGRRLARWASHVRAANLAAALEPSS
jgi:hypothetical protein